jgi:hypothetical protein
MKKLLLSTTSLLLLAFNSSLAQTIPNGDFEAWSNDTLYEEPASYFTGNLWSFNAVPGGNVVKVGSAFHGNFASQMTTVSTGGDTAIGLMLTGSPGMGGILGGVPYTEQPDSISFYAKYDVQLGDTAFVIVGFKVSGTFIAFALQPLIGNQTTWKRFVMATNLPAFPAPDTMVFIASSSVLEGLQLPGSTLTIDSVTFIGATAGIPNPSFENWVPYTSEEPDGWIGFNFGAMAGGPLSLTKSTNAYSGTYSAKVETIATSWGDTIGLVSNGKFYTNGLKGGMAVNSNPDKVTGYYQYFPSGQDTALIGLASFLAGVKMDSAILALPAQSSWTYFELPLSYSSFPDVDTLNITFSSSNTLDSNTNGLGSVLYIDNLNIYYLPLGMKQVAESSGTKVLPNPFNDISVLSFSKPENMVVDVELYDATGKNCWSRKGITSNSVIIDRKGLDNGIYMFHIKDANGKLLSNGKILIQ